MAWTKDSLGDLARSFMGPCVLAAAAELDVFSALKRPRASAELARALKCDERGLRTLLDALASLGLLLKSGGRYRCAAGVGQAMARDASLSLLPGARHLANCLRRWADLARVVKAGGRLPVRPSILGEAGDRASFIGAMHSFSAPVSEAVVKTARPGAFRCLLDIGGGSGTWTMTFLRRRPRARAVIFDLPPVIPMAARRLAREGFAGRVRLVAGDYLRDPLPTGADLAWLSAIIHQNSREQNRRLFARVHRCLEPGGRLLIRDVVMDESRTAPAAGALFAVNMLVATDRGGTFTLRETRSDLEAAGFQGVRLVHRDEGMHSILEAFKPR
ncbi:MAG: methyltransferase domain-containing protein [Elusimicrobia bacterium]|nr:methyltransferase domain-containing protein [Elusimicrobiota bacterium]